MSLAFVICVESGSLEEQSILLAQSIRKWCGTHADSRIVCVEPRGHSGLHPETLKALEELGVEHRIEKLNDDFRWYAIANKIFTAAWAEQELTEDVVVICDTDTFFINDPIALELSQGVAGRPVGQKKRGSTGPGDETDPYWERMYKLCGVSERPFTEATLEDETRPIRAYFNSGLVAARREEGVFAAWLSDFRTLMDAEHFPPDGKRNMDQLSLAVTIARIWDRVEVLEAPYNYMLRRRPKMPEPARSMPLEDLVHVHYRKWLHVPGFVDELEPPIPDGERIRWLKERLPLHPPGEEPG